MFQGTEIIFVSSSPQLLEAAKAEGLHTLDPAKEAAEPAKEEE
jgi:methionine salvage enolase-phosphatase E1